MYHSKRFLLPYEQLLQISYAVITIDMYSQEIRTLEDILRL